MKIAEVMDDITAVTEELMILHYDYNETQLKELEEYNRQWQNAKDDFHAEKIVRNGAKAFVKKWQSA